MSKVTRRSLLALPGLLAAQETGTGFLVRQAQLLDGTGKQATPGDLRVVGGRITAMGRLSPQAGERVLDAKGLTLCPGFIDLHNHSDRGLDMEPEAPTQVSQGITTVLLGQDGGSPWPLAEYLTRREQKPAAVNVALCAGHATLRRRVLGNKLDRPATANETEQMVVLLEQGMREGAFGLSSGLEYDPALHSSTEEVIALAKVASKHKGFYMSHLRDESDRMLEALGEAIRIGREAQLPVQVSHIKLGTQGVWGKAKDVVRTVEAARKQGLDITADCYPYDAWASTIAVLVPSRRHDDAAAVERGLADVGGAERVLITSCSAHREYERHTLQQVSQGNNTTPVQTYMQIMRDGGAGVVCRAMQDADIEVFYKQPWVMAASDGGIGMFHPRAAGTFPRVLGRFVRERRWLTLPEAVRKMTSAPAQRLGLTDRGKLQPGMRADLVLFDPARVQDEATFDKPDQLSIGMVQVFVNGEPVWQEGRTTGKRPGLALRQGGV